MHAGLIKNLKFAFGIFTNSGKTFLYCCVKTVLLCLLLKRDLNLMRLFTSAMVVGKLWVWNTYHMIEIERQYNWQHKLHEKCECKVMQDREFSQELNIYYFGKMPESLNIIKLSGSKYCL